MSNNENNPKSTAAIRVILCVIVMIITFLGMLEILDKKITIPISALMLIAIAIWNGIVYLKAGKKGPAIFTFLTSVILIAILVGYFIFTQK